MYTRVSNYIDRVEISHRPGMEHGPGHHGFDTPDREIAGDHPWDLLPHPDHGRDHEWITGPVEWSDPGR